MKNDKQNLITHISRLHQELEKIPTIESKLDMVLSVLKGNPNSSRYLTAQQIEQEFGIDQRTILNRSNLHQTDNRFIPSLRMKGRRKYFERKVIDRLLNPNR